MPIRIIDPAKPQKASSQAEDVARSTGTGLLEGAASIPGTIGDISAMSRGLGDWVSQKLSGQKLPAMPEPLPQRAVRLAGNKVLQAVGTDPRIARLATMLMSPGGVQDAPTSREVLGAVTKDKPLYQPKTTAGKYARTVAQFAPAAIAPGGPVRKAANVVVPAVASEAAGQATEGTKLEPYARVAGALLGGVGVGLAGRGGADTRMLAQASRGATDEQIAAARALMEEGQARGVRLTMAEALQQVTNSATSMGRMQRVLEGTDAGSQRLSPIMADRPAQVRQAVTDFGNAVGPTTANPSAVGPRAQQAAQGALDATRQDINALARPHYEAAAGSLIPDEQFQQLANNPAYVRTAEEVLGDPVLGAQLQGLPPNDLSVVDAVVQQLDRNSRAAAQTVTNPGGNNQLAAQFSSARGMADDMATAASPEWREARDIGAMGRRALLEPMEASPVGQIAATDSVQTQMRALYPSQPLAGGAAETASAIQTLNGQNPTLAPQLTRQHILQTAQEATQDNLGGPNQWGGAKWAAQVAGNPEQADALRAGVRLSGGDAEGMDRLIEVLRATGRRERPGSMTAYNARDLEELGKAGMTGEVFRTGLNPPGIFRRLGQGFQDWQTERNAGRLAEAIIASPEEAQRILMRAREVVPPGAQLRTIENLAIAAQLGRQPALEGPNGSR